MSTDLKNFWQRLQTGVEVAVAGHAPDKLLGVRDGFLRFFHDGRDRTVSVVVVPQSVNDRSALASYRAALARRCRRPASPMTITKLVS